MLPSDMVIVAIWWGEDAPATAAYGGTQRLLEAFLATMDVWPADQTFPDHADAAARFLATGE